MSKVSRLTGRWRKKGADLRAKLADPVWFATRLLGHSLWSVPQAILRSVRDNQLTAVKACHASSKTFTAAEAVLWWITRFNDSIAVTTAPTWTQVEKLLWGEVHKAVESGKIPELRTGLYQTELKLSASRYAIGLSTNEGVRFQGFHARHILVVLDEGPGVRGEIWEAIEGIRAGGIVHVLALGNPTITGGPYHAAFTSDRKRWQTFSIGAFDTPNLAGLTIEDLLRMEQEDQDALDVAPRPYLITRRWVLDRYHKWGPRHPMFQARVLGQFPEHAEDALLSLAWLEMAKLRDVVDDHSLVQGGIDVAGPGENETTLCIRQGGSILATSAWGDPDPRGSLVDALRPWADRLEVLNVDSVGIGYYLGLHLRDLGFPIRLVNVGDAARDPEHYANLKAEMYWGLRERAEAGDLRGLVEDEAMGQLAGIRYKHNARGQVVIESKEDARKRGVESPDRAEGILLAFLPVIKTTTDWQPTEGKDVDAVDRPIVGDILEQQF